MQGESGELAKETLVPTQIAFLGTGLMGRPMAENLIARGHDLTVWNRTGSKTNTLAALGAKVAETPGDAVAEADMVCMILENGPVVERVLFERRAAQRIRPGSLVIDPSSIPPETAKEHAARLARQGVDHLDAPVSGGPHGAEAGTLAIMVGGDTEFFDRAREVLAAFGSATTSDRAGANRLPNSEAR